MNLREITIKDEELLNELYNEVVENTKENTFEGFRELSTLKNTTYKDWLADLELKKDKKNLPDDYSPQINYLAFKENNLVGVITIRWELVPILEFYGGNRCYLVRPSDRRKGYGKEMLKELLDTKVKGKLDKVLITCMETNIASSQLIKTLGGIYDSKVYVPEEGCNYLKYYIHL